MRAGGPAGVYGVYKVERRAVGPLEANSYVLRVGSHCILVDPGGCEASLLIKECREVTILITHGHFDHVLGINCVEKTAHVRDIVAHELAERVYMESLRFARSWGFSLEGGRLRITKTLMGDSLFEAYGVEIHALYTPGHSPDHLVYYIPRINGLFSGDLLFKGSIGRWDLPGGDVDLLMDSLRKISMLPETIKVLPGHGEETMLREELRVNWLLKMALEGRLTAL